MLTNVTGSVALTPKSRLAITVRTKVATADGHAHHDEIQALFHRHLQNVTASRPGPCECRSACPLRDRITHHAINADRGEHERESGENSKQHGAETLRATAPATICSIVSMFETG